MVVLGIDPGLGGYVVRLIDGAAPVCMGIPTYSLGGNRRDYDAVGIWRLMGALDTGEVVHFAAIERQDARPPNGRQACFSIGRGEALWEAFIIAAGIPLLNPRPAEWQREMHKGVRGANPKEKSIAAAGKLFPTVNLLRTKRCDKPDHNKADALLIAAYAMNYAKTH